ncbi:hypothetical protein BB559_002283 [Furculomyces boomerangus]|uniref:Major facilitator superfamily (MFS) profile domain-containing protein n=1 Tax=Furculomyces boomerangus TaxID=61424 RepID=A0A2T9YWN8_9FUNG|nr:hypothetical protein BB559_002283 [Furculomyces boomerangus]
MRLSKNIYYSSKFQVILVGIICFALPGMFAALNSMGGGGQVDPTTGAKANTVLFGFLSIFGLLGGGIINVFGLRGTLFIAGLTYPLYTGSYAYLNTTKKPLFTIVSAGVFSIGSGITWATQGMVMTSYPLEHEKGQFIFIFWIIFSMGGILGSLIPLVAGLGNQPLPNSGYYAFVVIQTAGAILTFALLPPSKVIRSDNTLVVTAKKKNTANELLQIVKLFKSKSMASIVIIALSSNFYYAYMFNSYNLANFNTYSRGFNNLIFYLMAVLGSFTLSRILDLKTTRKKRAIIASIPIWIIFNIVWICVYIQQNKFAKLKNLGAFTPYSYKTTGSSYIWPCIIYALFGMIDAAWQGLAYWFVGSLSNDSTVLPRYTGFFKSVQSIGVATSWALEIKRVNPKIQLFINWGLLIVSAPTLIYLCINTKDTSVSTEVDLDVNQIQDKDIENSP